MEWIKEATTKAVSAFLENTPAALKQYSEAAARIGAASFSADELLAQLDLFEKAESEVDIGCIQMKQYIMLRYPEIKDEDNVGVRVQEAVIELIDKLSGTSPKEEKKAGSVSRMQYVSSRLDIEKSLKEITAKDLPNSLLELNKSFTKKLAQAWFGLVYRRSALYTAFVNNKSKIDAPRSSYSMVL
eukprot:RCo044010